MFKKKISLVFMLATIFASANSQEIVMPKNNMNLNFVPYKVKDPDEIISVRLANFSNHLALTTLTLGNNADYLISAIQLENKNIQHPRILFKVWSDSGFYGIRSWDIYSKQTDIATIWTIPTSATLSLGFNKKGSEKINLTGEHKMGVYNNPRFVRGGNSISVTTVFGRSPVLFNNGFKSGNAQYLAFPIEETDRIKEVMLLNHNNGYLLIYTKDYSQDRNRNHAERYLGGGASATTSYLYFLQLDHNFQPLTTKTLLIGNIGIFEFDADISGDNVFLMATTKSGYITAETKITKDNLDWRVSPNISLQTELVSPSVIIGKNATYAAGIGLSTKQPNQILVGKKNH